MRGCFALLATATILLVRSDLVESASQNKLIGANEVYSVKTAETASTSKRFLRRYDSEDEDDEERKVPINNLPRWTRVKRQSNAIEITPNNINRIFNTEKLDEVLDSKRADKLLEAGKLGGWLGKADLDTVVIGNPNEKREVFAKWRKDRRSAETVTALIGKTDPAIEKKYRYASVLYEGWLKSVQKNKLIGKKRKRGEM